MEVGPVVPRPDEFISCDSLLIPAREVLADPSSGKRLMNNNKRWKLAAWRLSGHGMSRRIHVTPESNESSSSFCDERGASAFDFSIVEFINFLCDGHTNSNGSYKTIMFYYIAVLSISYFRDFNVNDTLYKECIKPSQLNKY
ncbi:hypothetical protein AX774_g1025 [Zancudomyces culisetae]|uniref:Uncharacterized protein n=1 Tax=Zancudomyces culisetae TaxID=1213189 RepID=A0A1R1PWY0_ZANCU|nr:hypothetical protein AX774_g1025 [Zancudomyces culisetae]|eukprot:OMH85423.1 hypothetical protein AX774_g1025 [Zancudomyces culisetae]